MFAVLGVSHLAAQMTVSLFTALLGATSYGVVRFNFPRWSALGASLLVIGGPEIASWARQVMLDGAGPRGPGHKCLLLLLLSALGTLRYLYLTVLAVLAAVFTLSSRWLSSRRYWRFIGSRAEERSHCALGSP